MSHDQACSQLSVRFQFDDALLSGEPLKLSDDLTVFYGLNGSGKTRLLTGIRNALAGVRSPIGVNLVVSWSTVVPPAPWRFIDGNPVPVQVAIGSALSPIRLESLGHLSTREEVDARDHAAWADSSLKSYLEQVLRIESSDSEIEPQLETSLQDRIALEILDQPTFLLHPVGSSNFPAWECWIVGDPGLPESKQGFLSLVDDDSASVDPDSDTDPDQVLLDSCLDLPGVGETATPGLRVDLSPFSMVKAPGSWDVARSFRVDGSLDFGFDVMDEPSDAERTTREFIADLTVWLLARGEPEQVRKSDRDFNEALATAGADPDDIVFRAMSPEEMGHNRQNSPLRWVEERSIREALNSELEPPEYLQIERRFDRAVSEIPLFVDRFAEKVNSVYQDALLNAPVAHLDLHQGPIAQLLGRRISWRFARYGSTTWARLDELSRAERTWAERAIVDATFWMRRLLRDEVAVETENLRGADDQAFRSLRPVLTLIDEPEAAVHRAAEVQVARHLINQSADPLRATIVATHSPFLIDEGHGRVLEVRRGSGGGRSIVSNIGPIELAELARLGLAPSDLLRMTRVFLLVEGPDDENVLTEMFRERLRRAHIKIIFFTGAKAGKPVVESRALFDYTDAHVVVLVDGTQRERIAEAWQAAKQDFYVGGVETAKGTLLSKLNKRDGEEAFVRQFLIGALEKDGGAIVERLDPEALSAPDILDYLPVEVFIPAAVSWTSLRVEREALRESDPSIAKDFKTWLRVERKYGVDVHSPKLIARAVATLASVPSDLEQLMSRLEALSESLRAPS